jgi:hypothetical protein
VGGGVRVTQDDPVAGDVVAIGGDADVDGPVGGDVVSVGGDADLGPHAVVGGDVTVVGGTLHRDPAAVVSGDVNQVDISSLQFLPRWLQGRRAVVSRVPFGSTFVLATTIVRLLVYCILASIVLVFAREYVERIGSRASAEPVKAGLIGLLIQLLFFPVLIITCVLFVITIVGIPLLVLVPFALLALALLFLVGFTAVTYDVGRHAAIRFGWPASGPYASAALGIVLVLSPFILGRLLGIGGTFLVPLGWTLLVLGFLVEYAAWTVGLGAIALLRFERRWGATPGAPPAGGLAPTSS